MPLTFQSARLSNGLTILAEIDPDAATCAGGFFVRTGARDEPSPLMGVSHFLEHMMFKGNARLNAEALNRAFDEIGAKNNAYTSHEITCFYAATLPEHTPRSIELLGALLRPELRPEDFNTEKGVILEEIAMYKDNPFWVLYEAVLERRYDGHPMGHRVLGTTQTITALERDQMRDYFENRYSADNTTVALAGRVDFDAACRQIESICASWRTTRPAGRTTPPPPPKASITLTDSKVSRGYLLGMSAAPAATDDRRYAAALLSQVLGAPDNSRLHWALVDSGIAEDAQCGYDGHDGAGDYYVFASADPDRLDEIRTIIERELAALVDSITVDDLERLRNKIRTGATVGGERPSDRMQRLGRHWMSHGRYSPLEDELARIDAVTLDQVREVATAFPIALTTVGTLTPGAAN